MTEHEELLALRVLAVKQQQELARKDQTIEAQKAQIEKQKIQIENMIQALLHARKKLFGPSTEVSKHVDGQLSLFDAEQKLAEELAKEQKKITVPAHTRKARQTGEGLVPAGAGAGAGAVAGGYGKLVDPLLRGVAGTNL